MLYRLTGDMPLRLLIPPRLVWASGAGAACYSGRETKGGRAGQPYKEWGEGEYPNELSLKQTGHAWCVMAYAIRNLAA